MTKVEGEANMWSVDIDTDKYKKIIFTRVNGSGTVQDWGAKTQDLTIPTDGKNLFTLGTTEVWGGSGASGTWSTYAPEAPKTYKNITITVVANATPKIHYWEGGDKMVGTDYNSMPEMNATGAANTYSYTIKDVDEATGVNYLIKVGAVQSSDQHADKDVTINFKEILPQVAVQGVNNWNGTDVMTVADDYLSASITLPLIAKKYDLKLTVAGAWKGHKNENHITRTNNSSVFKNDDGNGSITADIAGDYVFTYTYATQTLVVTYPALPVKYNVTVTAENGTVTGAGEYEEGATATLTATPAEGYEFVNWTKGEEVVSTENPYTFTVSADVALVANFKEAAPTYEIMPIEMTNLTVQDMGDFVFLEASNLMMSLSVSLGVYADGHLHEGSGVDWNGTELPIVEGNITKTVDEEKGDVYAGLVVVEFGEGLMGLDLTMYSAVEPVEITIEGAEVVVNEKTGVLEFTATWTDSTTEVTYPVLVTVAGYEEADFKEYEGPQISELTIGDDDNWYDFAVANAVAVIKEGNTFSIEGEYTSGNTGTTYYLMIDGELPVVEEPEVEKPEPTYTENNLNPYAFGLESKLSDDKSVLNVTYRLNNSKATSVNVVVYNGEEVVATVAGTTTIGKNTVAVPTAGLPGGVELTWGIEVKGTSVEAPTQETKIYSIYHPSSVDIDNNPENPTFGMLLVNEAMQSVKTTTKETPYISKGFGAGIFAFTPSFDLMPNGELPGYNGGKTFSTATNMFAPRRIRFSKDGRIFATAQDGSGEYLWEINPENLNEWTTVFQGTNDGYTLKDAEGNFIAGTNSGFDVRGEGENLQLLMLSASLPGAQVGSFKCHTYDLGTATTWATAPTKEIPGANYMLVTNQSNVQFDKDGGVWYISYRGTTTEKEPGLVHINKDGVEDYKELRHMTRNAGFRFNHDFTKVIIAGNNGASKKATIYAMSEDANGAPVLTQETVIDMSAVGANLNDFAWDYAGNLYACGNSSEKLAAWAMPYSGTVETPAASKYAFQLEGEPEVQYEVYEDEITNLVFDLESMMCYGGPSEAFQIDVFLVLGEDNGDGTFALDEESSISVQGSDAKFISGYLKNIDVYAPKADAVIRCEWNSKNIEFHLAMSSAPIEATVVVVENAVVEVEKYLLFGDTYDYSLKMTGTWIDAEGLDYSVLVEIPVYYPEATEPSEVMSTVTVGSWDEGANRLGFGEGTLTVTTVGTTVTAAGIVENPMAGIAIDITISGNLPQGPGTALENATVVIKSIKKIQNGQLIIEKGGVQYNAQGAIVK